MTHFPISTRLRLHDEALLLPVLQHLTDAVARHVGTFHADAVLEGSLEAELYVQTLKDRVVLAHALAVIAAAVVAALERSLYAVAEPRRHPHTLS